MDKRERVARAIADAKDLIWDRIPDRNKEFMMMEADAAIAALEPVTVQEAARVLIPWFEQQHYNWAVSKGRNPKDYLSLHTHAADTLRALAEQDGK